MSRSTFRLGAIGPLVLAGVLVQGAFRLLVRPGLLGALSTVEGEVAGLAAQQNADRAGIADGEVSAAQQVGTELARTTTRVEALSGILENAVPSESVLRSLGELAAGAGIQFRRFAPEPEYRLDQYRARAVAVVAEGTFFDLVSFFERLSRLPHLVLIEDLELEPGPEDLIECRFVAVTVRAPEAGGIPGGDPLELALPSGGASASGGESGC